MRYRSQSRGGGFWLNIWVELRGFHFGTLTLESLEIKNAASLFLLLTVVILLLLLLLLVLLLFAPNTDHRLSSLPLSEHPPAFKMKC